MTDATTRRRAILAALAVLLPGGPAAAQSSLLGHTTPSETRLDLPTFLPTAPPELTTPPPPGEPPRLSAGHQFVLRAIQISGVTVFSREEIAEVTRKYVGETLYPEDLVRLRNAITRHYYDKGYVTSGAVIPNQVVKDGVLTIVVVEGNLDQIAVSGQSYLRPWLFDERLRQNIEKPFQLSTLQENMLLLLVDLPIERLKAALGPGERAGQGRLELEVTEKPPAWLAMTAANDRAPSIGALHGEVKAGLRSVFGYGDPLTVSYGSTEGSDGLAASYTSPLGNSRFSLVLAGEVSEAKVVEEPLDVIDVESDGWSFDAGVRYAVIHRLDMDLSVGASLARRRSSTYLLGEPYSYTEGPEDGVSDITVLRLPVEFTWRSPTRVLTARSTLSIGLPWLGATDHHEALPDSRFIAWLGQVQAAFRTAASGQQVIFRGDAQLASDSLLPIEQIAVGGVDTVRGYRENQLVRDNAVILSAEYRLPVGDLNIPFLDRGQPEDGRVHLTPFVDVGRSWSVHSTTEESQWLASIGCGLLWSPGPNLSVSLAYGYRLVDVEDSYDDDPLQDNGLHLAVRWQF